MCSMRITAIVAVTLLLGCSSEPTGVMTDDPAFSMHEQTVPFRANLEGTAQDPSDVVCPAGSFAGKFSLAGHATHLGLVAGDGSGCTLFTGPTAFVFLAAENRIVAANGDELWLTLVSGGKTASPHSPCRSSRGRSPGWGQSDRRPIVRAFTGHHTLGERPCRPRVDMGRGRDSSNGLRQPVR